MEKDASESPEKAGPKKPRAVARLRIMVDKARFPRLRGGEGRGATYVTVSYAHRGEAQDPDADMLFGCASAQQALQPPDPKGGMLKARACVCVDVYVRYSDVQGRG